MSPRFQELDWAKTPLGELSLRRRRDPLAGIDVYEVKLGDEFLMSSLFTVAEVELARLTLGRLPDGNPLDVVVGGLGLGYTARAVLDDERVRGMIVVDALDEVIGWHRRGLLPSAAQLTGDPRTRLVHADFFASAAGAGFDPGAPDRRFHAILVDIDHSPRHVLHPAHAVFYTPDGLRRLARHLRPGGVLGLWSNDPPDEQFTATLATVFTTAEAQVVSFPNPHQDRLAANTIYLATL